MSDGAKAKSVHCSYMLLLSPTVSPIEQTDKREKESACDVDAHDFSQRVAQTSESVNPPPFPHLPSEQKLTHTPVAIPTPHSRQHLPPSRPPRPPYYHDAIYPSHPSSPMLLIMVRLRRPHKLLLHSESIPQPPRLRTLFVLFFARGPYAGGGVLC